MEKPSLNSGTILQDDTYTWSLEPLALNPYISAKTTAMDQGSGNPQSVLTTQVIDQYGNTTQTATYPYNSTSTPLRSHSYTYLSGSNYAANYIFNRLVTASLTSVSPAKVLVQNTYDTSGSVTINNQSFVYGDAGLPAPHDTDPAPPVPYGARGNLVGTTTPAHTVWMRLNYGSVAGVAPTDGQTSTMAPSSGTNYAAPQTIATQSYSETLAYNAWLGITQTTGANGGSMLMTYDSIGRPATSKNAWVSGCPSCSPTYTYTYSAQNVTPVVQTKTGPDGVTTTTLDGLGRPIHVTRGDSSGVQSVTDTVYAPCAFSPLGKLQQVSQPYAPNTTPAWTVYSYDGIGRTLSVRQPDGTSTTSYAYSGNQTTVTDPGTTIDPVSGNPIPIRKTFTSDALGNLVTVTEPDPTAPSSASLITSYTYDWMNHVSCVDMDRGGTLVAATTYLSNGVSCATVYSGGTRQTRTFVYNDAGLLTAATNPENGTVLYYYNADNTLHYKHDAKGQETVYAYDTYKRSLGFGVYPSGQSNPADPCQSVNYFWDGGNANPNPNLGRLTTKAYGMVDGAGNSCIAGSPASRYGEVYNYYASGQLQSKKLQMYRGGQTSTVEADYYYDLAGCIANVMYPLAKPFSQNATSLGNQWLVYTYDSMGRPAGLGGFQNDDGSYAWWVQGVQYDAASRMTQLQYLAGVPGGTPSYTTETMAYSANGQLVSQNWTTPSSLGPTGGLAYSYAAGQNNGQINQTSDTISGETITYKYDALKRLTSSASTPQSGSSTTPWTENFQFDGFGNLTSKVLNGTTTPIAVNGATNQLTNASYDLNGNMTSGVGANFTFDGANRMATAAETSGGTEYYSYAPDNKRIYKLKANGTEEWTFYGGYGEKLGVFQYSTTAGLYPVRSTVTFAGRTIVDDNFPVFQDRVGTNRASGARFYPYGEEITSTANDREKFGTYTRDGYTGLDYADQRFYASSYGRFNTADPYRGSMNAKDPGSLNRYAYAWGDPINSNDPSGLCVIQGVTYPDPCFSTTGTAGGGDGGGGGGLGGGGGAGGGGYAAPMRNIPEPPATWDALSVDCQNGLETAHPAHNESSGIAVWLKELDRANGALGTLQQAADSHAIDWELLAAVAVRESGFIDMNELGGGKGVGVFQIDLGKNPNVSLAQANDLGFAANFAANLLATNMATLQAKFPNFTPDQLVQATADSYNFGTKNIYGNPNTMDVGSAHNNYGSNVLNLIKCFP